MLFVGASLYCEIFPVFFHFVLFFPNALLLISIFLFILVLILTMFILSIFIFFYYFDFTFFLFLFDFNLLLFHFFIAPFLKFIFNGFFFINILPY